MAFSYTIQRPHGIAGGLKVLVGTYNSAGVTGGEVITGLTNTLGFVATAWGSKTTGESGQFVRVNEVLPNTNASGAQTIVSHSNGSGSWIAIGN